MCELPYHHLVVDHERLVLWRLRVVELLPGWRLGPDDDGLPLAEQRILLLPGVGRRAVPGDEGATGLALRQLLLLAQAALLAVTLALLW